MSQSSNVILYGCQILSISKSVQVNYTLLLTNTEPEFEINFNVDTIHVLLAPLPIHWIEVLGSQITALEDDSTISKNVKMTQSQYESFFPVEGYKMLCFIIINLHLFEPIVLIVGQIRSLPLEIFNKHIMNENF